MNVPSHRRRRSAAVAVALLASGACAVAQNYKYHPPEVEAAHPISLSAAAQPMVIKSVGADAALHIRVGESTILRGSVLRRVYVGNPAILQTFTAAPDQLVVTAKIAGVTSLVLWDAFGGSRLFNVSVDIDPTDLRSALASQYPDCDINVEGGQDVITLTGSVPSQAVSDAVTKIAGAYSKDVVNSLRISPKRGKQVELKLQFIEVDRSKIEQFGINLTHQVGNTIASTTTGQFPSNVSVSPGSLASSTSVNFSNPLNFSIYNSNLNLGVTIADLGQKNVLQILAEPTLTTMSGQEAKFLSGGEFPFPMVQGGTGNSTAISIQFRPYGVKMDFTPTVNPDGSIHLKIAPEVSSLDYANAVTISGYTIPAMSTRRAETEVEVKDGQSFALTGLLDHRTTENLAKTPGIADIPILGQLFRSKNNQHSVTELVVVVTARVVDPVDHPEDLHRPGWAVPNITPDRFDQSLHKEHPRDVPTTPQPIVLENKQQ